MLYSLYSYEEIERLAPLKGGRLFITGGTGFLGLSLLEMIQSLNQSYAFDIQCTALTRNILRLETVVPHLLQDPSFHFLSGDLIQGPLPPGEYDFFIHGADNADPAYWRQKGAQALSTQLEGARRILEYAGACKIQKFLFLSSGAVYGKGDLPFTEEAPSDFSINRAVTGYGMGKKAIEWMCAQELEKKGISYSIARLFSFLGPYLPLEREFAAGNFIQNALQSKPICIRGNGKAYRSYLSTMDLSYYLLLLLAEGKSEEVYNVGGDEVISIAELARKIGKEANPNVEVFIENSLHETGSSRYVPNMEKFYTAFDAFPKVTLEETIKNTFQWFLKNDTKNKAIPLHSNL